MTRDKKNLYGLSCVLLLVLFFALFLPTKSVKFIVSLILLLLGFVIFKFVKKRSILSVNKKEVLLLMSVIGIVYLVGIYLSGIKFGFLKNIYSLSFTVLFRYTLPIGIIIISIEIIRSVLIAQENKKITIISYLCGILVDIILFTNIRKFTNFNGFMDLIGMTIFPAILSNFLYHFIAKKYGCYPNISFRLITTLYPYMFSVVPRIPDAIEAIIKLVVPILIYFFINMLYGKKKKVESHKSKNVRFASLGICFIIMISIAMLISCQFKYGMLVVATGSMTGEINKGDAVLYVEYDDQFIAEGQVILFEKEGVLTIHRVVEIQSINGEIRYYTKGDANEEIDPGYITRSNIKGIISFKISYIGYPSIWMRKLFSK